MDAHAPAPVELVAALLSAGYRMGTSHPPGAWSAVALDGPATEVVVELIDLAADPRHGARLERLVTVQHEHLAPVRQVLAVGPDQCALLVDRVPGPTLEALGRSRGPLSPAEAVTLTVPVADALEALHMAGLVHGDVCPATVVIAFDGRPMLTGLLAAVVGSPGTPGFVAPEVVLGNEPSPVADVHALARVVLSQLEAEPPTAGTDTGSGPLADARRLRDLLAGAADPDPRLRLGARELADACYRAHEPEPIVLPDLAVLARTELVHRDAGPAGAGSGTRRDVRAGASRTRGSGRRGSWRPGRGVAVTIAVLAVAAALLGPALLGRHHAEERPAPDVAARRLTEVRAAVLASGEIDQLAAVEVPGSPAHVADVALMTDLTARGLRVDGLGVQVSDVQTVSAARTDARVAVTSATSGYRTVAADGTVVSTVPAGEPGTVVLVLALGPGGWRVVEVIDERARPDGPAPGVGAVSPGP